MWFFWVFFFIICFSAENFSLFFLTFISWSIITMGALAIHNSTSGLSVVCKRPVSLVFSLMDWSHFPGYQVVSILSLVKIFQEIFFVCFCCCCLSRQQPSKAQTASSVSPSMNGGSDAFHFIFQDFAMVHACSGVSPELVEVHTQNYRIPVFQLSPLQDFPIPPNLCSLAPRKLFFLVLLARKLDFSQRFSYSCSPLLCSSTSGAHPWGKAIRDKGGKWRTSLYDFSKF